MMKNKTMIKKYIVEAAAIIFIYAFTLFIFLLLGYVIVKKDIFLFPIPILILFFKKSKSRKLILTENNVGESLKILIAISINIFCVVFLFIFAAVTSILLRSIFITKIILTAIITMVVFMDYYYQSIGCKFCKINFKTLQFPVLLNNIVGILYTCMVIQPVFLLKLFGGAFIGMEVVLLLVKKTTLILFCFYDRAVD
ncbi:hypothetical protein E4O04_05210 [Treponema sp. OMZ 799]|uniref:hypothetical protein n=1 Tax=Treponema sp. OMZ 799 TaxID=2563668 RepID=UPI0020A34727|nr:hypothetical protein [Treponema sp. OMZ 799]UTC77431.1 hypothetical protein E4O04_05210 [Treponema sp. OMZ 799]